MKPSLIPVAGRLSPADLSQWLYPDRTIASHVRYMSEKITDAILEGGGRLIVCMPPGHAKSDTISVHTPLWALELFPHLAIALTSYGHEKAAEWGGKIRDTIAGHPDKFQTKLKRDSKARHRWHTDEGGGVYCTGVGGALTGFRANVGIVDDPVKDRQEANSEVYRERTWAWFNEVFLTRLYPDATAIVVQTRWHEDDLAGRLLKQGGWDLISFPYFAEEGDILGREVGEPLWPEFGFDREWGEAQKAAIGSYSWAALYQQRPAPEGGSIFRSKHFRYFTEDETHYTLHGDDVKRYRKANCWIGQTIDTAWSTKTVADWTVCLTFAICPDKSLLVLDVERERLEMPDQMPFLARQRSKWSPRWQAVEDAAAGKGLIQIAQRQGTPFRILKADRDKVQRCDSAAIMYENGMIHHRRGAAWLADFEGELLTFPNGAHDDQVDCLAYACLETVTPETQFVGWF